MSGERGERDGRTDLRAVGGRQVVVGPVQLGLGLLPGLESGHSQRPPATEQ